MKKFTSTLFMVLACLYLSAQPGTLDPTFNPGGTLPGTTITDIDGQNDITTAMTVKKSDGSIYVTGYIHGSDDTLFLAHYLPTGALDGSFGTNGVVKYLYLNNTTRGFAIGLQSTGAVVVAGWSYPNSNHDFFVGRFDGASGAVLSAHTDDISGVSGLAGHDEVHGLAIQSDDQIVVVGFAANGTDNDIAIARYTAAGTALDINFNNPTGYVKININAQDEAKGVTIDKTSGDIVVAGTSNSGTTTSNFAVIRLTSSGGFNTGFNGSGILTQDISGSGSQDDAADVAIDGNGNIVVAGTTASSNPKNIAVARFSSAGVLDATFNPTGTIPGIVVTNFSGFNSNDDVNSVNIQNDNKIVVGGSTDGGTSGTYDLMLLRYTTAGALDITFGSGGNGEAVAGITGTNETGAAMALAGTKIYSAGYTQTTSDIALAVFTNNNTALPLVLSSFYAQKQTTKVVLQWQTSNEENVKQFVIERSSDGKTYKAIGQVAATGNSALKQNYTFADASPFMSSNNYYRLEMQDADGNYKYSKILIVNFDGLLSTGMLVFPSPAKDVLQVQLPDGMKGSVALQIIDMNGRIVKANNLASDGNALNTSLDINSLIKGVYILKAQAGNTTVISRFIKQ